MIMPKPKPRLDAKAGVASPLGVAISVGDRETLSMVRQAIDTKRLRLAYQPVVLARVPDLRLSINMSARSIGYARWMQTLRRGLSVAPTIGERLILEISESSAMQVPELVVAFMDDLKSAGVAFALDNFGSGNMAIRYFKDFYFDILKLDGQFIRNIHQDADNQVLTAALLSIGQHFQMFTVAQAVETAADAQMLQTMGVDCMQGYLFGAATLKPAFDRNAARKSA